MVKQKSILSIAIAMGLLFVLYSVSMAQDEPNLDDYYVYKIYKLDKNFAGQDGNIILCLDKKLISFHNPSVIYDPQNPEPDYDSKGFINAVLCVVSKDGILLDKILLEKPHADLSVDYLYGNKKPTYIVEQDFTAESGTYSGPGSMFAEVIKGKITFLETKNEKGEMKMISLGMSLKNSWKIIPSKNRKGKDIIIAQYHPDWDAPAPKNIEEGTPFVTEMTRYYFDGKKWNTKVKTIQGGSDFEDESAFPDVSIFP